MAGHVKAGHGTFVGNAGEHYVVAELLKRGVVAALAPRNAPAVDVLAAKGNQTVRIRVKTKSEEYDHWQWVAKKDKSKSIFLDLSAKADFTVLVNLTQDVKGLTFYVVPTKTLNEWLVKDFERWVSTPGKHGQPRDSESTKRNLSLRKYEARLAEYRDNWSLLWK